MRGTQIRPGIAPKLRWLGTIEVDLLSKPFHGPDLDFTSMTSKMASIWCLPMRAAGLRRTANWEAEQLRQSVSCHFVSMAGSLIACRMVDRYVQSREWHLSLPRS